MKIKQIFLVDAIGALLSCVLLGFILVTLERYVGMPVKTLQYLAIIAFSFSLFSIGNHFYPGIRSKRNLKVIAVLNLLYCLLTLALVLKNFELLKPLGLVYFLGEIVLIVFLARLELRVANS